MPYHIHHSEGIVCSVRNVGEHDREYRIFTREHGYIRARARSVRMHSSRLRYALQTFSLVRVDHIRARGGWKITSAIPKATFPQVVATKEKRVVAAQAFRLLLRLVQGEEKNEELFDDLVGMLETLARANDSQIALLELTIAMRILYRLGYWGKEVEYGSAAITSPWSQLPYEELARIRKEVIPAINDALRHSHL